MTGSCKEILGSSHYSVFTWKTRPVDVLWVREFEPSLFEPGVYFNIKCIGKLPGPTNEFERSLVFDTGEFERPKFDCTVFFLQNLRESDTYWRSKQFRTDINYNFASKLHNALIINKMHVAFAFRSLTVFTCFLV